MENQEESKVVSGRFGKHCIAPGCTNYYYKAQDRHYHQLPLNDKSRLKQWLQSMKRKAAPVNSHARVCSDHFTQEDYEVEGFLDEMGVLVSYTIVVWFKPKLKQPLYCKYIDVHIYFSHNSQIK